MQLLPAWPFRLRCPAVLREQKKISSRPAKPFEPARAPLQGVASSSWLPSGIRHGERLEEESVDL
jgi:hypothetical protein